MTPQRALEILIATSPFLPPQLKAELVARLPSLTLEQIHAVGYFLTLEHRRASLPADLTLQLHQLLERPERAGRRRALPRTQHVVH